MMTRIKKLAAAGAVVVGMAITPSAASAAIPTGIEAKTTESLSFAGASALYNNWATAWLQVFDSYGEDSYGFESASSKAAGLIVSQIFGLATPLATPVSSFSSTFAYFTTTKTATYTLPTFSSVSVPGPIAGAGLPILLGLAGFAAYRRRQTV